MSFIDKFRAYREGNGLMRRIEPICETPAKDHGTPMSPSCYHAFRKRGKSAREAEDERLSTKIAAIYAANYN